MQSTLSTWSRNKAEGDRESRLPRSDHRQVEDGLAVRGTTGHYPRPLREIEQRPVLFRALLQQTQPLSRVAQECGHAYGQRAQLARAIPRPARAAGGGLSHMAVVNAQTRFVTGFGSRSPGEARLARPE
jgi:hypothetical protein